MKLRFALMAILAAAITVVLANQLPRLNQGGTARQASTSESLPLIQPFSSLPRDSAQRAAVLRESLLGPYRLRPDRRLLLAAAEIRRLSGAPDSAVTARFAAGRWTLLCGAQELGTLPELPDFPAMLELLTELARKQAWAKGWAENSGPDRPSLARALDRLDAPGALREADRDWAAGARDAGLFRDVARAYALLALETPEEGELADPIVARSLAALSFARALGADDPRREACLLAEVMGYSAAATELARRLPARDPVRLYVTWEDAALERAAASAITPEALRLEAPYFHLLRLASRGDYEAWFDWMTRLEQPGVPTALVLGSGLRIPHPEPSSLVGEKLLEAIAKPPVARKNREIKSRGAAGMGASLATRLQRIEAVVDGRTRSKGTLYGPDLARAHERALLYAALDRIAQRSLEWHTSAEMSRWFAPAARGAKVGRRAAKYHRWYAHLAGARVGKPDVAALRADVDSAAPGPNQALRSYDVLRSHLVTDDAGLRAVARGLVKRMDSRPAHRSELAKIAERDLLALSLAERLDASAAATQGALDGPDEAEQLPDSIVGAKLAQRAAAAPTVWLYTDRYAAWLEERQNNAEARRVIERWRARSQEDSGSASDVEARARLARLHQLGGHPELGLRLMGDLHRTGQFRAMERTALLLQDLGQKNQALAIAWAAHRNRPHLAAGRALLAELFWRQERYGEAAKMLQEGGPEFSSAAWAQEVAPRFVAFFRTRGPEGVQAAEALIRAGFVSRSTFGAIPQALGAAGLYAFAFDLQSRLRLQGMHHVESSLLAYGYLARAKGEGAALQWIQGRVAEKDRELLTILAYQEHHPELLWSMAPARMDGERADYQWLLRAAACLAMGSSQPRYAETVSHLDRARGTHHLDIARYLLGLAEEAEVLAAMQTPRQRSEISYFIGLKNEQRGRFREAADWYWMSVESGAMNNIESRWAAQRLRSWATSGTPADRVAPAKAPPA